MILQFCSKLQNCASRFSSLNLSRCCSSDTIFALSSGQGKCGVAVIRISGSNSETALKALINSKKLPNPRTAILRSIQHPKTQEILDKGLVLWFPRPKSFTGEDCCELHIHGGLAVINAVLNALGSIPFLRLAEPGEFTRRAFHNGKLDLTEVEGLSDLLQAETEIQRKQAFLQSQGSLSNLYNRWKHSLLNCVAYTEAHIDFDETETLERGILENVTKTVTELSNEIKNHISDGRKGEILRNGVKTVILGEPNVGKSSLLNLLCQRPAAIVTPIEGTTRDVLEVTLNISGYPLVLADTAGLRLNVSNVVEKEGISRALQQYEKSDLILLVTDTETYLHWKNNNRDKRFDDYLKQYLKRMNLNLLNSENKDSRKPFNKECLIIVNKIDLATKACTLKGEDIVNISCKTEEGIPQLLENISHKLKMLCGQPSVDHPSMNQMRHRQHLTDCLNCLELFLKDVPCDNVELDFVLVAEHLRKALRHIGKLVGSTTTDQLLDVIFKEFCIGK